MNGRKKIKNKERKKLERTRGINKGERRKEWKGREKGTMNEK